jgi:hypothetical protein
VLSYDEKISAVAPDEMGRRKQARPDKFFTQKETKSIYSIERERENVARELWLHIEH